MSSHRAPTAAAPRAATQTLFGEFLRARRVQCTPEQVGLPAVGRPRRVTGLRREEVAQLAKVSTDYYTRLEQGRVPPPSNDVLDAIAEALLLSADQRAYMSELARRSSHRCESAGDAEQLRPQTQALLGCIEAPGFALGPAMDVLAWNPLAATLFIDFATLPPNERNLLRLLFLDDRIRSLYTDWSDAARVAASMLRMRLARYPGNPRVVALAEELAVLNDDFRRWWNANQVTTHSQRGRLYRHPTIGVVNMEWSELTNSAQPDVMIIVLTPAEDTSRRLLLDAAASLTHPARRPQPTPVATER
jgi:transcriptional regulator with XRE-family HTH domain